MIATGLSMFLIYIFAMHITTNQTVSGSALMMATGSEHTILLYAFWWKYYDQSVTISVLGSSINDYWNLCIGRECN